MAIPHPLVFMCGLMIGLQLQPKILPGSIQTRIEPSSMLEMQQNGDLAKKGTRILTTTISKVNTVSPNIFFSYEYFKRVLRKPGLNHIFQTLFYTRIYLLKQIIKIKYSQIFQDPVNCPSSQRNGLEK